MDEVYYYYEKNFSSRDVRIVLKTGKIVEGYIIGVIPADEVWEEQVLLMLVTKDSNDYEVLANEIESIEVIEK